MKQTLDPDRGFTILINESGDASGQQWLVSALAVFASHFPGQWRIVGNCAAAADAALCYSSAALTRAHALGMPAVARLPLGEATPPGTLGLWGGDPAEAGCALALLAREPALRLALCDELAAERHQLRPEAALWRVEGPFDSSYSLAIVNRELALALAAQGVATCLDDGGRTPDWNFIARHGGVRELYQRSQGGERAEVVLYNTYPPEVDRLHGRINVLANYAWEESGFPPDFVRDFNWRLNLITVVSPLVKKILRDNGVRVPIAVVGNGVDHLLPIAATPLAHDLGAGSNGGDGGNGGNGGGCRFLHVSSCFPRKGVDALLDAWGRAFRRSDAVTLVIKSFPNPHNDAAAQIAAHQAADPDYPAVVLIDEDLTEESVVWLYEQCDVFVLPTRAEGFGLPIAEATLHGLPVIVSGYGGHRLISEDDCALVGDYDFSYSRSHLGVFDSAWIDPDVDDLARLLRQFHAMPQAARQALAARARERLLARLSWRQVAARTRAALNTVATLPALPKERRIAWISTWNSRCGIAAYSQYLVAHLPRERLRIFANSDAEALTPDGPEVFRCWQRGQAGADRILSAVRLNRCASAVVQWHPSFLGLPALRLLLHGLRAMGVRSYLTLHNSTDLVALEDADEIRYALAAATRVLVHGVEDLNRLKSVGLVDNVALFPHGVVTVSAPPLPLQGGAYAHMSAQKAPPPSRGITSDLVGAVCPPSRMASCSIRSGGGWGKKDTSKFNLFKMAHTVVPPIPTLTLPLKGRELGVVDYHDNQLVGRCVHTLALQGGGGDGAGVTAGRRLIGSFGYIRPHKGLRQLIEAFALLAPRHPDVGLLLLNSLFPSQDSAEELAACEALIAQSGLSGRIQLDPRFLAEDEALVLLARTAMVVFPYQHSKESSSAAVRMGIGSGRPVLVTPLPIFADVAAAVEFLPGIDAAAIAAGIDATLEALADPARRAACEEQAAPWREAHRWPKLAERLLNLIEGEENDPFGYDLLTDAIATTDFSSATPSPSRPPP